MKSSRLLFSAIVLAILALLAWLVVERLQQESQPAAASEKSARAIPVVTAAVVRGPIEVARQFTGTLEASAEFVASPKVAGIVEKLTLNLGDAVSRAQQVALLDSAEYDQAVIQAEAELAVAQANLQEANSQLTIDERELKRIDQLRQKGVSSASQRDAAQAEQLARTAHVQVARAELARAKAQLETARIRRGYTEVLADWQDDDARRFVAERFVDEGENVDAKTPLLKIVKLDPLTAVLQVTEKDYAGLQQGMQVALHTDAYPEQAFHGMISRIAPVFQSSSRQARVEISVSNPDLLLKPGMFVRARVVLRRLDDVVTLPAKAVTRREGVEGVFLVDPDSQSVHWKPLTFGLREPQRVQVLDKDFSGEVVTLGQQLLKDGSRILLPGEG